MRKSTALIKNVLLTTVLTLIGGSALAVGPVFWEISKQDDVIKGDARGVSIAENGSITLAPDRQQRFVDVLSFFVGGPDEP